MAKFINTRKAIAAIEDLIKNAEEKLVLISPYLKLSKDFKELLTYRNNKEKLSTVIFGKQELNPDEMKFLEGLRFVILKFNQDLHAKCYLNDSQMIITSLNLYEFSMANNKEMGVLIDKGDTSDQDLFEDALAEIDYIVSTSKTFKFKTSSDETIQTEQPQRKKLARKSSGEHGFCIRCGVDIQLNPMVPYCRKCFSLWKKYENPDYQEKHCHICGKENISTINKPTCYPCYKTNKTKLEFPLLN